MTRPTHFESLIHDRMNEEFPITTGIQNFIENKIIRPRLNETGYPSACLSFNNDCLFWIFVLPIYGFEAIHRFGVTPYLYHSDSESKGRHVHYKATFITTAVLTLAGMATFLGVYGFSNAATREQAWWGTVDKTYHNATAVVTFGAAIATVSASLAFLYNLISKAQSAVLGKKPLPGVLRRMPYLSAPFKPFAVNYIAISFLTILYFTLNPDSYFRFAESGYAHAGSVALASLTTAVVTGILATVAQKTLSVTHDLAACCSPRLFYREASESKKWRQEQEKQLVKLFNTPNATPKSQWLVAEPINQTENNNQTMTYNSFNIV